MLELYQTHIEDLWFKEKMMSDEQTMAFNHACGGTIPFPEEYWADWYDRWIINHNNQRFYRYIKENDTFIGEAAYYFDEERQIYIADVIIYAPYRGKGYGRNGLLLLCETAKGNGIMDPAFGAGSSPKSKAVPQPGIHMKLRVDPGLLHGFEPRLHDPPAGDAVPVTDTGIGGRITFGILAQSRVLHDDRTGTGQITAAKGF